ncbi:tetratricopeptide repeat protein [Streptomyces sp. NPDC055078]
MGRSMQELLKQRRLAAFVGRRAEIALFAANLDTSPEDDHHRFLFHIHGNAGVGKSSLVRRLAHTARGAGALTATLDESAGGVPEVLEGICAQFAGQGVQFKALERMLATYRQRRYEAESVAGAEDPAGPPSAAPPSTGSLVATQAGLIALGGLVPGASLVTGAIDPARVAARADAVRAALSRHFGKAEDVQLVLEPAKVLTPVLLSELERIEDRTPWITLFFDTYERTAPFLDPWLSGLIVSDRYGPLPGRLIVTTSGQRPLDPNVWADYADLVTDIPLSRFTDAEARQLLAAKRVVDEDVVRDVLRLSGRLPVLVSTLAENAGRTGGVADPSATAVERFLKGESDPVRRSAALDGALPRRLNEDVFRAAAGSGDSAAELFGWLCGLPFVSNRGGRAQYHDVVREPMLRLRRNSSPERWSAGHTRLAEAFAGWCATDGEGLDPAARWAQDGWRELRLEENYHRLCARPRTALPAVLRDGVDACDAGVARAREWARSVADAGADTDSDALRALARECHSALDDEGRRGVGLLGLLIGRGELDDAGRVAALVIRGRDQRILGDHEDALRDYGRAIALDAGCRRAHFGLGETRRLMGRHEEALADFARALALDPDDSVSLASMAQAKHDLGRSAEALADLDRAVELSPRHVWALVRRSQVRRALGDGDGALADIGRARELAPDNPWIVGEYGEILRVAGRHEEAIPLYDRALVLDPAYAWALGSRAMAKQSLGRTDEALADLGRALELNPGYLWALLRRADIHRERGDGDAEFADLDRVVERADSKAWALVQRGYAHALAGRHEDAVADYDAAVVHDPSYAYGHVLRGRAHEALGRHDAALADLDRALELAPGSAFALAVRARLRRGAGDPAGELADLDAAVGAEPDESRYLALRGQAHHRAGRYESAIADAAHLARLGATTEARTLLASPALRDLPGAVALRAALADAGSS